MNFGIYWTTGYPQFLVKFSSGGIWAKLDYGMAPFAYAEKLTLRRDCWYFAVITWDKPSKTIEVYLNGLKVGENHDAGGFIEAGDKLYIGNPMMLMRELTLTKRVLTAGEIERQYDAHRPESNGPADQDIRRDYIPQQKPDFNVKLDDSWIKAYSCSFLDPADLNKWLFQTGDKYRDLFTVKITDEGLLIKTPDIIAKDSRIYLWSPQTFEGDQWIEFDFRVESPKGLSLLVVAASGSQREDFVTDHGLPRTGAMGFILGQTRNYHWEFVRRVEAMRTDVETQYLAKNPWGHRMFYGCIPRLQRNRWYRLRFVKLGNRLYGSINGRTVFDIEDSAFNNNGPVLNFGRIGLRQMYSTAMQYRNFVSSQ